jgi:hypothetical protein
MAGEIMGATIVKGPLLNPISSGSKLLFIGLIALLLLLAAPRLLAPDQGVRGLLSALPYLILAATLALVFVLMELIAKPRIVYILQDGAVLVFRRGDQRFVPWDQWEWVVVNFAPRTSRWHRIDYGGKARIKGRTLSFWTTFDIAHDLQQAYVGPLQFRKVRSFLILSDPSALVGLFGRAR